MYIVLVSEVTVVSRQEGIWKTESVEICLFLDLIPRYSENP